VRPRLPHASQGERLRVHRVRKALRPASVATLETT
jgi:hypothetical protein